MTQTQLLEKLKELRSLSAENEVVEFKEAKKDFHFDKFVTLSIDIYRKTPYFLRKLINTIHSA